MKNQIEIYVDGSFRRNGKVGIGVYCKNGKLELKYSQLVPEAKTSNEAEYWAIAIALNLAKTFSEYEKIIICSDSKLAVNQINGKYETKKAKLKELKTLVCGIANIWHKEFGREVKVRYIPREKNKEADKLAQEVTR